jgi:hypothetical protein
VGCLALAAWATSRIVLAVTGSALGAATAVALLLLNPNLLYLHATPMTEPMLLAVSLLAVLWLYEWAASETTERVPWSLGAILFLAAWTRYEAWPILAAAIVGAACARGIRQRTRRAVVHSTWRLAVWPGAAVVLFLALSRATVGAWFVSGGFYELDPTYDGQAVKTLLAIWWGTHRLSGYVIEIVALATVASLGVHALRTRDVTRLIPIALFAAAAVPAAAFFDAHPFRIRYMVPMVSACIVFCGLAVGLISSASTWKRSGTLASLLALALIGSSFVESAPWNMKAPLLAEAQWDAENGRGRQHVTDCLAPRYRGEKVLASMGSLAHYMQELSHHGFDIADFIHEGNGALWELALETGPAPHAGWMLTEEQSEGGDALARRARAGALFTRGMTKMCEGGGVSLYSRSQFRTEGPP